MGYYENKNGLFIKIKNYITMMSEKKHDFYQRCIIGAAMGAGAIFLVLLGGFWFNAAVLGIVVLSAFEFINMINHKKIEENKDNDHLDIVYLKRIALVYILIPALSIIFIRQSAQGTSIILWLFLSIWSVDTAGYIVGSLFGKNKLYPSISPNKTIEGALGGVIAGLAVTTVLFPILSIINGYNINGFNFYSMIFISLLVSVLSIIGDLFESYIKRQCGVKNSGTILLSHGGIMDRIDSLTFTAPVIVVFVVMKKGIFF